jgi:hypothetical protein
MATAPLYSSYSDAAYAFDYFSNAHVRAARAATPAAAATPMPTATSSPMMYILFRHNNALLAMMQSPLEPDVAEHVGPARRQAETTLKQLGWAWPQLLDQPYPDDVPGEAGAKYERSFVKYVSFGSCTLISNHQCCSGQEYLTLTTPNATPTARQRHALAVLGYTFPLLSLTIPNLNAVSNIRPSQGNHHDLHPGVLPHLNNHLRQIGMGPIVRPRFHMRDMLVFRPILLPLFMLSLRAMILLYIFSPSRKPFFALMIGLWVLYEVWKAIAALAPQPGQQAPAINGVLARNVAAPNNPARAPAAPVRPGNPARTPGTNHPRPADAALESVSKLNFDVEERALQARPEDEAAESINAPPTTAHKIKSFVALFATTLHPAVWDRRRAVLSRREGQIRTESNARERQDDAAAEDTNLREDERRRKQEEEQKRRESREALVNQHARRPRWVKDYIERVRINEWED